MKLKSEKVPEIWHFETGDGPLIATAIHDGHDVRPELNDLMSISGNGRLREEDPFTGEWTRVANSRIVGLRSRFEVDLNRPREKAVYISPEDAWGLNIWRKIPSNFQIEYSLAEYDAFYAEVHRILSELEKRHGRFVVFDLHTYNHLREGPYGPAADPQGNPEVNIGTGTLDRSYWAPVVDVFVNSLQNFDYFGRQLDVRENIKFRGGNFPRWVNQNFPKTGCAIAIEFKKFFMNEWTGEADTPQVQEIKEALQSTVPFVLEGITKMPKI